MSTDTAIYDALRRLVTQMRTARTEQAQRRRPRAPAAARRASPPPVTEGDRVEILQRTIDAIFFDARHGDVDTVVGPPREQLEPEGEIRSLGFAAKVAADLAEWTARNAP